MASMEGLRLKINKYFRIKFASKRSIELKNRDFTIISNNCWGGMIYESYNLKKNTPTVGLFFLADDYIKFVSNIKDYVKQDLLFIKKEQSKNKEYFKNDVKFGTYPIGKLGDIEIYFLHYKSEDEALKKWNRRLKRINYNNIILKFNDQNGCTLDNVNDFFSLPYKNKLFFTVKKWNIKYKYYKYFQIINKKYILFVFQANLPKNFKQ